MPYGSNVGPALLLLYVGDMHNEVLKSIMKLFADFKLYATKNNETCIQNDIDQVLK